MAVTGEVLEGDDCRTDAVVDDELVGLPVVLVCD